MKTRFTVLSLILALVLVGLVACAGLKVRLNKSAIAREGGLQMAQAVLKYTPEAYREHWYNYLTDFPHIKAQLEDANEMIMAEWLKMVIYNAVDMMLTAVDVPLDEDILDLIRKSQAFFYFECEEGTDLFLCQATPEQRLLGIAFCEGVIQAAEEWNAEQDLLKRGHG